MSRTQTRKAKGFTLIELLVVIAIIAILVIIVIVAINPLRRLEDASDSTAESNIRQAGSLISTCIAGELSALPPRDPYRLNTGCADATGIGTALANYGNLPTLSGGDSITVLASVDSDMDGRRQICAYSANDKGSGNVRWLSSTGAIEGANIDPLLTCPDI